MTFRKYAVLLWVLALVEGLLGYFLGGWWNWFLFGCFGSLGIAVWRVRGHTIRE